MEALTMQYLLFSQQNGLRPDEARLMAQARSYFDAHLAFGEGHSLTEDPPTFAYPKLSFRLPNDDIEPVFYRAVVRCCTEQDYLIAQHAERVGKASGMAMLAKRCRFIWELHSDATEQHTLLLCAVLASGLLGPIVPPDKSTLLGVRSARERGRG